MCAVLTYLTPHWCFFAFCMGPHCVIYIRKLKYLWSSLIVQRSQSIVTHPNHSALVMLHLMKITMMIIESFTHQAKQA